MHRLHASALRSLALLFTRCGDIAAAPDGEREREDDGALGSVSMRLIRYLPCLVVINKSFRNYRIT